jgi:hypothetical protein
MGTMLEQDVVEGVDVEKVRHGLWLLAEAGLTRHALAGVRDELTTDQCAHCKRHWQRSDSPIVALPAWRQNHRAGVIRATREKLNSLLEGYEDNKPVLAWRNARTCEMCILDVADHMGRFVSLLPKKLLNAFCRMFAVSIAASKGNFSANANGNQWKMSRDYKGYVALTNAVMQHLNPVGNARARALLMKMFNTLGML